MQKALYEKPKLEVTLLETEDILTSSPQTDDDINQGEWDPVLFEDVYN